MYRQSPPQAIRTTPKFPKRMTLFAERFEKMAFVKLCPGHARKMMAKMEQQGHSVMHYENIEGGTVVRQTIASPHSCKRSLNHSSSNSFLANSELARQRAMVVVLD